MAGRIEIDLKHHLDELAATFYAVPENIKNKSIARALNHSGAKVFTRVKRDLSDLMNAPRKRVAKILKKYGATANNHTFSIRARDVAAAAKDYKPSKRAHGIAIFPFHKQEYIQSGFFGPAGHVFVRRGRKRLPIDKKYGPPIPPYLVSDSIVKAANDVIVEAFKTRMPKEIAWAMGEADRGRHK